MSAFEAECRAFISLARQMLRNARQYRRWASESATDGRWSRKATEAREHARWALQKARDRRNRIPTATGEYA